MLTPRVCGRRRRCGTWSSFPSRVGADDQRYLCLAVRGGGVGRRLFCPGGKTREGRVAGGRLQLWQRRGGDPTPADPRGGEEGR